MRKKLALFLAAVMLLGLCACGDTSSPSGQSAASDAASSAAATAAPAENSAAPAGSGASTASDSETSALPTAKAGTLTMATNASFPPYEFIEGGEIVGIDAEIAQAIAGKLGLALEIDDMEFDSIIEAVRGGKADIGLAGMTVTPERQESVNFTDSYSTGIQVVIVTEDSEIDSVETLNEGGYTIGVQRNTTGDLYTTWDLEENGLATIDRYSKGADAVQALVTGKVDCVVIDNEPAKAFVAEVGGLKILDTEYIEEQYAGAMNKDNTELYEAVNGALAELIADGTVQGIIDKYISTDSSNEVDEAEEEPAGVPADFTTANEGKLTMATNASFPPYEFIEGGDIQGIDAEIAAAVADKLGLELVIDDMEFDSIIEAVRGGKADIGLAGMTVTPERQESVNFTESYSTGVQVIIVKEDSAISSVDDLFAGGYVIGVQRNTTGDLYTTWDLEDEGLATIDRYSKGADAVQALVTGKVDCVVIDNEPAKNFVAEVGGLKILDTEYIEEQYAGAMSKDNDALYQAVNAALKELIADGTVQSIVDKYISAD